MKLYFLRHGKAEESSSTKRDYDRRLTPEGVTEMEGIAAGLVALGIKVDRIASSPLPRAQKTAEITALALGVESDKFLLSDLLAAGSFGIAELQSLLKQNPVAEAVMLVGHEPDLSSLVRSLTGATIEMKKSGLALVETDTVAPHRGVLRWLLPPRHLLLIAGREK